MKISLWKKDSVRKQYSHLKQRVYTLMQKCAASR